MPVEKGNILLIPSGGVDRPEVTLTWSQGWSSHTAKYHVLNVKDKADGKEVIIFIAEEWDNEGYLSKVATKVGGDYELVVDSRLQYGQQNASGDRRFVVFHDKSRKPYQHRFIETTLAASAAGAAQKVAGVFGYGSVANVAASVGKDFIGDYLHTF